MQMQLGQLPELRQQPDVTDLRDTVGGDVKALQVFQCLGSVHATQVVAGDVPTSGEKARPGGGEEGVRGPRIVLDGTRKCGDNHYLCGCLVCCWERDAGERWTRGR